jgi:hypothetical protein
MSINFDAINSLTRGKLGKFDTVCPACSAGRHSKANRKAKIFRIWRNEVGFATYYCVHCGEAGCAFDGDMAPPDPKVVARAKAESAERDRRHKADRLGKARWLWGQRRPIVGSIGERYLRERRGIVGTLPATLGFLPGDSEYPPAMIAAFGLAHEIEPGAIEIADDAVTGVHLTRLLPDGSDRKRGSKAKIMIGHSMGSPIVLAPPNDMCGLVVAEGIESTLTAIDATGLCGWAAGSASRMPALAEAIGIRFECVTIVGDDHEDGRRFAGELAERIAMWGIEVRVVPPTAWGVAA